MRAWTIRFAQCVRLFETFFITVLLHCRGQETRELDGKGLLLPCVEPDLPIHVRFIGIKEASERILSTERRTRVLLVLGEARGSGTLL